MKWLTIFIRIKKTVFQFRNGYANTILFVITFWVLCACPAFAQQSRLSKGVNYVSEFIASDYFKSLLQTQSHLDLVDTIYTRALSFNNYNYSETLLCLTFATIPYNNVPIKIPLINVVFNYPLICASDSVYNLKNANLPKRLFTDTPQDDFGDKDKLAHFFGSAFLTYSQTIFDLTELIGYFVECFEDAFKVQSNIDYRDIKADNLGDEFGKKLKENRKFLPSEILKNKSLESNNEHHSDNR